jgi:hypothetical protein
MSANSELLTPTLSSTRYVDEADGQEYFVEQFGIDRDAVLGHFTDGVHNGNILEFKLAISGLNQVLFQAVKYCSKLRLDGRGVPRNILLVDLNAATVYRYDAADYYDEIHQTYTSAASRDNRGFRTHSDPTIIKDCFGTGAQQVVALLAQSEFVPVMVTEDCVVPWAERFYREVRGSDKAAFLNSDPRKGPLGELRDPRHFKGLIKPYAGENYQAFSHILDRLNDKLKKIELGAFYTPRPYALLAHRLLEKAIARVPEGNDFVIIDRCAGSGNLLYQLSDELLSHVIVNTFEQFEYQELAREFGQRVRAVIPPTFAAGDPKYGMLLNGDALSDRFVLGVEDPDGVRVPNVIQQFVDDPRCTIILMENPPYAEVAGIEAQKSSGRDSFGWKDSYVKREMTRALTGTGGTKPANELSNLFIWSAFRYYLREPTDSYIVFSPFKYKQHRLIDKKFLDGYLVNRKHFHAGKDAGVTIVLWSNEDETRTEFPLQMFDIDKSGELVAGANHRDAPASSLVVVRTANTLLSTLYDGRSFPDDEPGIACEKNGTETQRKTSLKPIYNDNIVGYLVAQSFSFENADLMTQLTRCAPYNGHGTFLRRDQFLKLLPLFAVGRFPSEGRFWIRGVVNRCTDGGDGFMDDLDFLKSCLIYTSLAYHNKCRSFTGSDGRIYRNELCFDGNTAAAEELANFTLTGGEVALMEQWHKALNLATRTRAYDPTKTYGPYQIDVDLNERHRVLVGGKPSISYDYPQLNGELKTLKHMLADYYGEAITPKLWEHQLLK